MRRKPGQLLDLEARILAAMVGIGSAEPDVHGFALAKLLTDQSRSRGLTSHGTLYKALARLEGAGLLTSRWEDAAVAEPEGRPRRRLYRVSADGRAALGAHVERTAAPGVRHPVGELGIEWR